MKIALSPSPLPGACSPPPDLRTPSLDNAKAEAMMKKDGCAACHAIDKKIVGPAYVDVAAKYKGDKNAVAMLSKKSEGRQHRRVGTDPDAAECRRRRDADITELVTWIMSLKK